MKVGRWAVAGMLAAAVIASGCQENLTAPGTCPAFCPLTEVVVLDTVVSDAVDRDSTYVGYVTPQETTSMPLVSGSVPYSVGVIRFHRTADTLSASDGSGSGPVVVVDSFRLHVVVLAREGADSGQTLVVHRLPAAVDASTTLMQLAPYFEDSTVIDSIPVPDDSIPGDSLSAWIAGDAFPDLLTADDGVAAIGLALVTPEPSNLRLVTREGGAAAVLSRYTEVRKADGSLAEAADAPDAEFDSFLVGSHPTAPAGALVVGGVPAARALLHVNLPPAILDSSTVVRATLLLVPADPVLGRTGDSLDLRAEAVSADLGPKSPIIPLGGDTLGVEAIKVAVGSTDSIALDVTRLVRAWQADSARPRLMALRSAQEGTSLNELRFFTSQVTGKAPALHVTYVPFAKLEAP